MTCVNLLRSTAAVAVLVLAVGACGGDSEPKATSAPGGTGETTNNIEVKDFSYKPEKTTVKVGTTVTWTFADNVDHNVEPVGGAEPALSPDLKGGKTYPFTFGKPGTFAYRCGIHNSMTGSVVVTA